MNVMTMIKNKLYPPAVEIRNILMRKDIIKKFLFIVRRADKKI